MLHDTRPLQHDHQPDEEIFSEQDPLWRVSSAHVPLRERSVTIEVNLDGFGGARLIRYITVVELESDCGSSDRVCTMIMSSPSTSSAGHNRFVGTGHENDSSVSS